MHRTLVTFAVMALGLGFTVPSAAATDSDVPAPPSGTAGSAEFAAGMAAARTGMQASPYVQASSPAQAIEILDALRSPQTASPAAKQAAAVAQYGPCTLNPSVLHLRTSGGRNTLGTKPTTDCSVPVTSIRHNTELRYKWLLVFWWLAASYPGPGNQGERRYEQKNVEWQCNGTDSTTWAGTTLGTIVYGGQTYYARVYQDPVDEACGG